MKDIEDSQLGRNSHSFLELQANWGTFFGRFSRQPGLTSVGVADY